MALSRSLQKGQTPLSCQLCEDSIKIKWKCMDCQLLMCKKCCEKIHSKIKSAEKHTILDIKDIAISQPDIKPDFSSINCDIHYGQLCCFFCKKCEEVVCPLCIAKTHHKHNRIELSEGHDICVGMLKTFNTNLIKENIKLGNDILKLDLIKEEHNSKYEKEKEKILRKEKELIDAVHSKTKELIAELDKERNNLKKTTEQEEMYSKEISQDLELRSKQIASIFNSSNTKEVFKVFKGERKKMKQTRSINGVFKSLPIFVPIENSLSDIGSIYGFLQTEMEIQADKEYTTDLGIVGNMRCCNDGSLWLSDPTQKKFLNVSLESSSVIINKTFDLSVNDMALTPSGDLLLSTCDNHLQVLSPSNGTPQKSCYSASPLVTTAVHVTKDYKVIVGAIDNGPPFPVEGPRKVIVMNKNGRRKVFHHLDTENKPIFTFPHQITTDSKNNLYVIDLLFSDGSGRVVMLTFNGGVRGVYNGHLHVNRYPFKPYCIIATESENIIVADRYNHALHILNTDGQCTKYQNTKDLGIMYPYSLDMDRQQRLFIGCSKETGSKDKAKLYLLKM